MTPRENILNYFKGKDYEWFPNSADRLVFEPVELHDFKARGMVNQQNPIPASEYGGKGWFDINWFYEAEVRGSITKGSIMDDLSDWRDVLVWPDLDAVDWEGIYERNKDYLNTDKMISSTIYTGYFERLISFVDFEDAACALIDPDYEDDIRELFQKLTDLYIDFAQRMHKYFNVEYFLVHDDWGTQRAPMISPVTHKEMIFPYIKQVIDAIHDFGGIYEQHSCGLIYDTLPNIFEAGTDTWVGQPCCDKEMLVNKYHDIFKFGVMIMFKPGMTDEDRMELLKKNYEIYKGKNVWFNIPKSLKPEQAKPLIDFLRSVK